MSVEAVRSAAVPAHIPPSLIYDFDLARLEGQAEDSIAAPAKIARGLPPIFYGIGANSNANAWVISGHDLAREVLQTPEIFSSLTDISYASMIGETWQLIPVEADAPVHGAWRAILNPVFSPARMKALEPQIEAFAIDLVESLRGRGHCDFVTEFADVFPIKVFLGLFGLPPERSPQFLQWSKAVLHAYSRPEEQAKALREIVGYLRGVIADRTANPTGDLISYIIQSKIEDRALTDDELIGVCVLLFIAGLDTLAQTLNHLMRYLAEHPAEQQRLRDDPDLIPQAIEEMLRAFPVVMPSRKVKQDVEFHGIHMKSGEIVRIPLALAGRDPKRFDEPDTVDFDREDVGHITFAAGPHRCLGSHLARRELRIAIHEWLQRMPPFRITAGKAAKTHGGVALGFEYLPLSW